MKKGHFAVNKLDTIAGQLWNYLSICGLFQQQTSWCERTISVLVVNCVCYGGVSAVEQFFGKLIKFYHFIKKCWFDMPRLRFLICPEMINCPLASRNGKDNKKGNQKNWRRTIYKFPFSPNEIFLNGPKAVLLSAF